MKSVLIDRVEGGRAFLSEKELHHLIRVLRARDGDLFEGVDGRGNRFHCVLTRDSSGWIGKIVSTCERLGESPLRVTLGQALIKKVKFEWVIQKAVELGVVRVIPVVSERTEVQLNDQREERKMRRWRRILAEAVKQSGRSMVPELGFPLSLADLLEENQGRLCIALDESGGESLHEMAKKREELDTCLLLIGPEGGWGDRDRELFSRHSVVPIHVGPRILRSETASVVALSLLQYEFGDLGSVLDQRAVSP